MYPDNLGNYPYTTKDVTMHEYATSYHNILQAHPQALLGRMVNSHLFVPFEWPNPNAYPSCPRLDVIGVMPRHRVLFNDPRIVDVQTAFRDYNAHFLDPNTDSNAPPDNTYDAFTTRCMMNPSMEDPTHDYVEKANENERWLDQEMVESGGGAFRPIFTMRGDESANNEQLKHQWMVFTKEVVPKHEQKYPFDSLIMPISATRSLVHTTDITPIQVQLRGNQEAKDRAKARYDFLASQL